MVPWAQVSEALLELPAALRPAARSARSEWLQRALVGQPLASCPGAMSLLSLLVASLHQAAHRSPPLAPDSMALDALDPDVRSISLSLSLSLLFFFANQLMSGL